MPNTPSRKKDHVDLCVNEQVSFRAKSNGLEDWEFVHNALPELDLEEIDPSTTFLEHRISFPLMVTGMTGGYADAERINGALADACQELRIPIGSGSMRQALESARFHASYRILRKNGPDIPVLANIGAAEVARMRDAGAARRLVDLIDADALVVHTNPLQELLQPEGTPRFRGVLEGLAMLVRELEVPVMLKEVGAGISREVAMRAYEAGVRWIDVAGAGGTSWSGVEILRRGDADELAPDFWDWGIPTARALEEMRLYRPPDLRLIASGGVTDGVMVAKCLALGAELAGTARPMLTAFFDGGMDALLARLRAWRRDLRGVMFLTGAATVEELKRRPLSRPRME
ncbi:MAG: type 2 isopentenyl-diphosphate Delta-isomerase [Bacteroidota bacterium]|jgi:isopentenyl-diphosphate delta-isomerase|nr:type 2 isopentenyl-diphosphate Delta-isomerase [Bacteroidota bacterium]